MRWLARWRVLRRDSCSKGTLGFGWTWTGPSSRLPGSLQPVRSPSEWDSTLPHRRRASTASPMLDLVGRTFCFLGIGRLVCFDQGRLDAFDFIFRTVACLSVYDETLARMGWPSFARRLLSPCPSTKEDSALDACQFEGWAVGSVRPVPTHHHTVLRYASNEAHFVIIRARGRSLGC